LAKKLLCFLGNTYYHRAIYYLDSKESKPQRFIQASLAEILCKDWTEEDSINIFLTDSARKKNWQPSPENANNIKSKDGKYSDTAKYEGLFEVLNGLKENGELKPKIKPIFLTEVTHFDWQNLWKISNHRILTEFGFNFVNSINHAIPIKFCESPVLTKVSDKLKEQDIWIIFNLIVKAIDDNDEIYFDITHGFRALPMVAMAALNYTASVKKNIKLAGIYYGALEALDYGYNVREMDMKERRAPIFDLTNIAKIQQWSAGVDRFIDTGDASKLTSFFSHFGKKNIDKKLKEFGQNIATCRGKRITQSAKDLRLSLEAVRNSLDKYDPYQTSLFALLNRVSEKINKFGDNEIENGLHAVQWCIDHGLTQQQGFTILQETITTIIAKYYWGDLPEAKFKKKIHDIKENCLPRLLRSARNDDFCVLQKTPSLRGAYAPKQPTYLP